MTIKRLGGTGSLLTSPSSPLLMTAFGDFSIELVIKKEAADFVDLYFLRVRYERSSE